MSIPVYIPLRLMNKNMGNLFSSSEIHMVSEQGLFINFFSGLLGVREAAAIFKVQALEVPL